MPWACNRQIQIKNTINAGPVIHVTFPSPIYSQNIVAFAFDQLPITLSFRCVSFLLNGTATGMVAFIIANKSRILCVKLQEERIRGRALVEPV